MTKDEGAEPDQWEDRPLHLHELFSLWWQIEITTAALELEKGYRLEFEACYWQSEGAVLRRKLRQGVPLDLDEELTLRIENDLINKHMTKQEFEHREREISQKTAALRDERSANKASYLAANSEFKPGQRAWLVERSGKYFPVVIARPFVGFGSEIDYFYYLIKKDGTPGVVEKRLYSHQTFTVNEP